MNLHKSQTKLLATLLQGPLPHNASSRDVIALLAHIGTVQDHGHDRLLITVGSEQRVFAQPRDKDMTSEELSEVRHFLLASGITAPDPDTGEASEPGKAVSVVVIDHHVARLYRAAGTPRPESLGETVPHDPHGYRRHLIHRRQADYRGDRIPEDHAFYKAIATELKDAPAIVIIGHATGKSDAAAFLLAYLRKHDSSIANRIVGTEGADLSALTDPEIEALVERHFDFKKD